MSEIKYSLPEWSVLSAASHKGDLLYERTVLIHPLTFTIIEVIPIDDTFEFGPSGTSLAVEYIDEMERSRKILFRIHFTLSNDFENIFNKVAEWYGEYLAWDDNKKLQENRIKQN